MANQSTETNSKNISLETFFKRILKGEPLEIEIDEAYDLLNNLNVNMTELQPKFSAVMPFLLVHFIKSWPGWQKSNAFFGKEISFDEWFKKFKEYLSFKLNFIIKNEIQKLCEEVEQFSFDSSPYLFGIDNSTQTDDLEGLIAPYTIEIEAPPRFLNTMIFSDNLNNDIILKEYNTHEEWSDKLTIRQLINWPNVEIKYKSKEMNFKRCNSHEFQRFLGCDTHKLPEKESNGSCVVEMDIIEIGILRNSYSLNVIKEYCNMYISVLKKQQKLLNWSDEKLNEVEIILEDLMLDIIDIDKKSMATNTSVLFNIGKCTYSRNKIMKSSEDVKLTDLITPQTLLSFIEFKAFDASGADPFPFLKKMENEVEHCQIKDIVPEISYRCTFCNRDFPDHEDIWRHLKNIHAMELPVMCFRCQQQFTILTLTEHRWQHHCLSKSCQSNAKT